jgi:tetratricopeptide (TPR) repeat protein
LALLRRAIAADADFALAKAFAGYCHVVRLVQGWAGPGDEEEGLRLAREAIAAGAHEPATLRYAGHVVAWLRGEVEIGRTCLDRALALNPNSAQALASSGHVHMLAGDASQAVEHYERAIRLSPLDGAVPLGRT